MSVSFTLAEWCAARKVSRSTFYILERQKKAPKTHRVGVKRLISPEADAAWLRAREAEAEERAIEAA
jgi:predicted DNA-binding transcriptional regulator AlpA